MKINDLRKVIEDSKVCVISQNFGKSDENNNLVRKLTFLHEDHEYTILWYCNLMTLTTQCGLDVIVDDIKHSNTWPNRHKRNLQFYKDGEVVAVLGLEKIGPGEISD